MDLYCDGSAVQSTLPARFSAIDGGSPASTFLPPGTPAVLTCLSALAAVGDVAAVQTDRMQCLKSISFGTTTKIWLAGAWSPELQCPHADETPAQTAMLAARLGL